MNKTTFDKYVRQYASHNGFEIIANDSKDKANYRRLSSYYHNDVLHVTDDGDFFVIFNDNGIEIARVEYGSTMFAKRLNAVFSQARNAAHGNHFMDYEGKKLSDVLYRIYNEKKRVFVNNDSRFIISIMGIVSYFMDDHRDEWCKVHNINRKELTKDSIEFTEIVKEIIDFTDMVSDDEDTDFIVNRSTKSIYLNIDEMFAIFQA